MYAVALFCARAVLRIRKNKTCMQCCLTRPSLNLFSLSDLQTPDSVLEISPMTPKDRSDLEYMLSIGVDWVALSFVQTPSDIEEITALIDEKLPAGAFKPAVMAKIEKPSCFVGDNLEQIIKKCDGIMVARGDVSTALLIVQSETNSSFS